MAVRISIDIYQNSQSTANNTSNVTVQVTASWTNGSYNHNEKPGSLVIDGTTYVFASLFNINNTTSGTTRLFSKTLDIKHGASGEKTLVCSASYTSGVSSGTVTASASKTLTTISRLSTVSASKGTLGVEQTLTVSRINSGFTHAITYTCGGASGTVYEKGSATSPKWAPPISLAAQNTTGNSVSIKLTVTTYNGTTSLGTTSTTFQAAIPDSVKPTATLALSDPTGHLTKYGGFVQSKSKMEIKLTGKGDQGSTISSYQIKVDGTTYNASSQTVSLPNAAKPVVIGTVTDSRTRTGSSPAGDFTYLAYSGPKVTSLAVTRCAANGTTQADGAYAKATFTARITALNNKNSAAYTVEYRTEGASSWTPVTATGAAGSYSPSNVAVVFPAATGSAFEVRVVASDDFGSTPSSTRTVPIAFALLQGDTTGTGLAVGQMATEAGVFAVGLPTKIKPGGSTYALDVTGDIRGKNYHGAVYGLGKAQREIPSGADFNSYTEFGVYAVTSNAIAETLQNRPIKYAGTLVVSSSNGTGDTTGNYIYILQTYRTHDGLFECFRRVSTDNTGAYQFTAWQYRGSAGWVSLGLNSQVSEANSDYGRMGKGCFYRVDDEKHVHIAFCCGVSFTGSTRRVNATLIPENYRPKRYIYTLCAAGGRTVSRLCINPAGEILIEWVQDLSGTGATASFTLGWMDGYADYWLE